MDIRLKTGEIIKIISLIPKAFHATHLSLPAALTSKPGEINIYFSYGMKDLENKSFADLPYIQFKPDPQKPKGYYKPVYNSLDKAYDYCFIETDKAAAAPFEIVLHYEGL